jgi:hypothetical protein
LLLAVAGGLEAIVVMRGVSARTQSVCAGTGDQTAQTMNGAVITVVLLAVERTMNVMRQHCAANH